MIFIAALSGRISNREKVSVSYDVLKEIYLLFMLAATYHKDEEGDAELHSVYSTLSIGSISITIVYDFIQ